MVSSAGRSLTLTPDGAGRLGFLETARCRILKSADPLRVRFSAEVQTRPPGIASLWIRDPACRPWLTDYLPELAALDEARMPAMSDYGEWLGPVQVTRVLIEALPSRSSQPGRTRMH